MTTTIKKIILICSAAAIMTGCDKDFVEINTDPYGLTNVDPALIFAGAQRTTLGNGWETENTAAQQFVNPFNSGATLGLNFNEDVDNFFNGTWNGVYTGTNKNLMQALAMLGPNTTRVNLKSMIRIWRAYSFMLVVDTYGDVPYSEAGRALEGIFYPKYDDDAAIYADLEKEIRESLAAFSTTADYVPEDLFYGKNSKSPSGTAAVQVGKWKKLGNSILLRLGMRYSKVNPTKAAALALEAFNGGVMTSNADQPYVSYDGTFYTNGANGGLINNNPYFYYAAEPFVNQLKNTNDPRSRNIIARYNDPQKPNLDPNPLTAPADQFGVPVGVISTSLANAPYRGAKGAGYDYSQMNVNVVASQVAPTFWITYTQTALLLAEAAKRTWIPGGDAQAQVYYESAIRADMARYSLFPGASAISTPEQDAYLAQPGVAYNAGTALQQINTQYWIASITQPTESWVNFRRSGFPALTPNTYNNLLNGGFARRLTYPDAELANNRANYQAAVQAIGGSDNLTTRVFWDTP